MAEDKPGHFLRQWRQHRHLTLEQVAAQVPTTHATLSRVERGKVPYNQHLLEILAGIYQTEPASLIMRDPTIPDAPWTIFDTLTPVERKQVVDYADFLKRKHA